jgi:GT2 family glycosyltransferase
MAEILSRVVIAISAYRSNQAVLQLLAKVFADDGERAAGVIVVDSENDGSLQSALTSRDWPVRYENSPVNLGSAGNLARRLELAADMDADWCFAINHDGEFDASLVEALVRTGRSEQRVGAVYPRRILTSRSNTVLRPHRSLFEMPKFGKNRASGTIEVAWDSSNGALYALAPVRAGVKPWADLWMGWEDLAFGWQLSANGWKQLYAAETEFLDDYEYEPVKLLGRRLFITRKPPWYSYYRIRNLILILRRMNVGLLGWLALARRVVLEVAIAVLFRNEKAKRLRMTWMGLVDGLRGVTGRGRGR